MKHEKRKVFVTVTRNDYSQAYQLATLAGSPIQVLIGNQVADPLYFALKRLLGTHEVFMTAIPGRYSVVNKEASKTGLITICPESKSMEAVIEKWMNEGPSRFDSGSLKIKMAFPDWALGHLSNAQIDGVGRGTYILGMDVKRGEDVIAAGNLVTCLQEIGQSTGETAKQAGERIADMALPRNAKVSFSAAKPVTVRGALKAIKKTGIENISIENRPKMPTTIANLEQGDAFTFVDVSGESGQYVFVKTEPRSEVVNSLTNVSCCRIASLDKEPYHQMGVNDTHHHSAKVVKFDLQKWQSEGLTSKVKFEAIGVGTFFSIDYSGNGTLTTYLKCTNLRGEHGAVVICNPQHDGILVGSYVRLSPSANCYVLHVVDQGVFRYAG